jgi:hypothetical protein
VRPIRKFILQLEQEEYRWWLIELLRPDQVILITARPTRYQKVTLARIKGKCGWEQMDAYFAVPRIEATKIPGAKLIGPISSRPHMIKEHLLKTYILPKYGKEGSGYFGLESNPHTCAMYTRNNINAIRVTDQ